MDIAERLAVGESGTDVADRAVPERGEHAGLRLEPVDHDTRPVAADLMVAARGRAVTAVMHEGEDIFAALHAAERDHRHLRIHATVRVLPEIDRTVAQLLSAVDTDVGLCRAVADRDRFQLGNRFNDRLYQTGAENIFRVGFIDAAPAFHPGHVRRGVGMGRGDEDIFDRHAGRLGRGFSERGGIFRLHVADLHGEHERRFRTVRERHGGDVDRIVDGCADLVRVVAVEQRADRRRDVPSCRAEAQCFDFFHNEFLR